MLVVATAGNAADKLVINNVGNPTSVGTGLGKRAIWTNAGSVGGVTVDIVGEIKSTTRNLNHNWTTTSGRPSITSVGQDDIFIEWRLYRAGTYNLQNNSGGEAVVADIHVQFNDVDGPNNERVFAEVCKGPIQWVRIDATATTEREFGTVAGRADVFSLVGDRDYNNQPVSGVEIFWPNASTFDMGRTANSGYLIRLDNPTYSEFTTLDFQCADFMPPVAVNDSQEGRPGSATVVQILDNDSSATNNDNPPNNNTLKPSEFARDSVNLIPPAGATNIVRDSRNRVTELTVPGEGRWTYSKETGGLTFTPDPSFRGMATTVDYSFTSALKIASNPATVTVWYPGIGVVKSSTFNDENGDSFAQAGETISYLYTVRSYGVEPLRNPEIRETGFTGQGTPPVPVLQSGDVNRDGLLDLAETWTYAATYTLVAADLAGAVSNSATASGETAAGTRVSDVSDSSNPTDGNGSAYSGPGPNNDNPTLTPLPKKPVVAGNDAQSATIFANTGASNAYNVFGNDTLNGVPATPSNVTIRVTTPASNPGVTLNPATGLVSVAPGTPAGTYTIGYQICDIDNASNCASAVATVVVTAVADIGANADNPSPVLTGPGGSNILNALGNDTLNGEPVTIGNVDLTVRSPASDPGVTLDPATGLVSVAPGTPPGDYSIAYRICEKSNPTNCADSIIHVVVSPNVIAAANDSTAPVTSGAGGSGLVNALANDTLNGTPVPPATIDLTVVTPASHPGVTLDPATGLVSVAPGTPAGNYSIAYRICEKLNSTNCALANVTVPVTVSPIAASADDAGTVTTASGGADLSNVLANDMLNGVPVVPGDVDLTITSPASHPGVTLNPATGGLSVAPGTPAGTYSIGYRICEKANPSNCATATVAVVVAETPLAAANDTPPSVSGRDGNPNAGNVFDNDALNGQPVDPEKITASVTSPATPATPGAPVPVLDPATGVVSVPPSTPAGNYTIGYRICETANPGNCVDATVTIVVTPTPIAAQPDSPAPVNGATGGSGIVNAFENDRLNGRPIDPAEIVATVIAPATPARPGAPVPALDPATGLVDVPAGTPAGSYSIGYQICEKLNPENCATSTVVVTVTAPAIVATPDAPAPVNGGTGGTGIINAFQNDTLNGQPVDPDKITATVETPATPVRPGAPVPALDPATGLVDVPPGTPAGTYTIDYRICETLNPENCATGRVTIVVAAPEIVAEADSPAPVRSGVGNPQAINAFANDRLNGQPVDPAAITATVLTPAAHPGVTLDPVTGNVAVGADVPAGTYVIEYRICETLNPENCATGRVTVVVEPPLGALAGTVFTDMDADGVLDPDEPRRAGWEVEIVRDGEVVGRAITDQNGDYRVEGLLSGPEYEIRFRNPDNGVVYNVIRNVQLTPNGTVANMNQPIDPSGVLYDAITRQPIPGAGVTFTDRDGNPLPSICFLDPSQASQVTGASGEYRFDIVPGAAPQCPASETVYRIVVTPPAGYAPGSTVLLPQPGPFDPTGMGAPVRINPDPTPPVGGNPPFYLDFRLAPGDPDVINNHIALDPFLTRTPLVVTKTSIKRTASVGDIVPYEITVRNAEGAQRMGVTVVDILPPGTKYITGSSAVNGAAQEPVVSDRKLEWRDQTIPGNGAVRYSLSVVIGAGVTGGEKVNTGVAENGADGTAISNRGTAVVSIVPSAVFDCSELLGKVFEDRNRNGYQDKDEPGVPGVRLATVNGQLVTTDDYGRYHIACAAVPDARIGSNFVLKLDPRTLPLGWATTTDNPRSIRLTRGKFGELNFGVAPEETPDKREGKGE